MSFPITITFGTLYLLLITVLALNTSRHRAKPGALKDPQLKTNVQRASRAHGNTLEHSLPVILLMLFAEVQGSNATVICTLASVFLAARLIYAWGMLSKPGGMPMVIAAGVTYLIELVLIGVVISGWL